MSRRRFLQQTASLVCAPLLGYSLSASGKPGGDCSIWSDLVEYARWSPSPHNIQPWRLKVTSDTEAELLYDTGRLLPATDPTSRFTIVGMGMFITCLDVAAAQMGYTIKAVHEQEPMLVANGNELRPFARLSLQRRMTPPEVDPELILKRRTSRLHYDKRAVAPDVVSRMSAVATRYGFTLKDSTRREVIDHVIDLNRETLFKDLDLAPARIELSKWIRTTDAEAASKKDGLWSKCMRFRGTLMHKFFFEPEKFRSPWKRRVLGNVYEKSMKGTRHLAWLSGSFSNRADWLRAGEMFQHLWMEITKYNVYMHPFGSVITNENALRRFESYVSHTRADGDLWLLFRMGYSDEPPRSYRLDTKDILIPAV